MADSWIILTCANRQTLSLASNLAGEGFEVFAPILTTIKRVPRRNVKREVTAALFPGFVFVAARHLWTMVEKAEDPRERFKFTVFNWNGQYRATPDGQLDGLRREEMRVVPREKLKIYAKGETIAAPAGAFEGMSGVVIRSNAKKTQVLFNGRQRVEFLTFALQPVQGIERLRKAA